MPWFISDVTIKDFKHLIEACANSNFSKEASSGATEGEGGEPKIIKADNLRTIGQQWNQYFTDGIFVVMAEDYWTYPHVYKDMKKFDPNLYRKLQYAVAIMFKGDLNYRKLLADRNLNPTTGFEAALQDMKKFDPNLYRKLQYAVAIMFKGDLNYRKLLADRNLNPTTGFEAALQGFIPAPLIAVRTVKAELICGLPKGKWDALTKLDAEWMQKGDYGVIQYCPKGEPLKISDRPCIDYCQTCFGVICPEHTDM
ncbi:hypothetical protein B5X24_HaOG205099 [Helicoverpa armigera]|uniref:Sugar phosphate phosphatase n=1 Tax=Helicoverpa armigera TaxID=29058 RepID=A0A2W1BMG9_HELAM|nr:hypothetical protein B5X24_HaOG205099 [Helicoverpa armigera]